MIVQNEMRTEMLRQVYLSAPDPVNRLQAVDFKDELVLSRGF